MTDPFTPPASAFHAAAPGGDLFIWQVAPDLVAEKGIGFMSLPHAQGLVEFWRPFAQSKARFRIFIDLERVTNYTREARDLLTTSSAERLRALESLHILMSSKSLALGVGVFKHEIGDALVHTYSERASFLRSYDRALRHLP